MCISPLCDYVVEGPGKKSFIKVMKHIYVPLTRQRGLDNKKLYYKINPETILGPSIKKQVWDCPVCLKNMIVTFIPRSQSKGLHSPIVFPTVRNHLTVSKLCENNLKDALKLWTGDDCA